MVVDRTKNGGHRRIWTALATMLIALGLATPLAAQVPLTDSTSPALRVQASRAELEQTLRDERARDPDSPVVPLIERRLRDGDLQVGDLVVLQVVADSELTDTFTVRPGRVLQLPRLPDIQVGGVLRSELDQHLSKELARYLKQPDVEATALVRVAVTGGVTSPGFYSVPGEMLASDIVMLAGGLVKEGDIRKVTVRRGDEVVLERDEVQQAFRAGASIDQLNLQSGDELQVGTSRDKWQMIGLVSGLVLGVTALVWRIAD